MPEPTAASVPQPKTVSSTPSLDTKGIAQVKSLMGAGKAQQSKIIHGLSDHTEALTTETLDAKDSLYIKGCSNSVFTVNATCTKVFVESCDNIKLFFNDRIITHTVEVWKCNSVTVEINTTVQTLQVDMCEKSHFKFKYVGLFKSMIWSSCEELSLGFADSTEHQITVGTSLMKQSNDNITQHDQFIARILPNKVTGKAQLLNELIVRLENGFPTTEREARIFEERQEANLQALAKEILGKEITINKKKDTKPKAGRNDPCTCGSGKKYKKCCGTDVF
ncbi:hypothetical protein MP638_003586 [Amoeboaphelidium occidentale]|nr:hypothetical protein MP638_003586 [Amoeboaphelidium occidentale]